MAEKAEITPLDPGDWTPIDLAAFTPEQVWEMPSRITSIMTICGRLFVTMDDGRTVDMTDAFVRCDVGNQQPN